MKSGDVVVPYLPADIIADILSRLPVRLLCQLRCVSKSFLSLISNPNFIKQHFYRNNKYKQQSERLFLLSETSNYYSLDLESPILKFSPVVFGSEQNPLQFTTIWGSCDGLLLVSDDNSSLFVVNPSTRDFRELPRSQFLVNAETAWDKYGFGFDASSYDYKVVRISYKMLDSVINSVSVYDLRADSWRQITNSCPYKVVRDQDYIGVLLNGALHWLVEAGIISFSLANEKISFLSFPSDVREKFELDSLGVIQGCLSVVDYADNFSDGVDVWVMKDYGVRDSWEKTIIDLWPYDLYSGLPLKNGRVLLSMGMRLGIYDLEEGEYKDLVVQGFRSDVIAIGYEESLLKFQ